MISKRHSRKEECVGIPDEILCRREGGVRSYREVEKFCKEVVIHHKELRQKLIVSSRDILWRTVEITKSVGRKMSCGRENGM